MTKVIILLILLTLIGCAGHQVIPPAPKVVEVKIAYPVPCVDTMPDKPKIHDDFDLLALNDYDFIQAIHVDRLALDKYSIQLESLLLTCKSSASDLAHK